MRIGIDLGGTKIAGMALASDGKELAHERVPTPAGYEGILDACAALAARLEAAAGAQTPRLGICLPGAVDAAAGKVRFCPNIHALQGRDFAADMKARYGRELRLANDAASFTLSEASDGAAAGAHNVYGVILGTGVGGCQVAGGKILNGPNAMHEWGHVSLPWAEADDLPQTCGCGRKGCIETYLSGPALHRQLRAALGRDLNGAELAAAIAAGDSAVMAVMDRYCTRLAKALAMLVLVLDPDVIVLGGGLSNLDMLYADVPPRLGRYTVVPDIRTRLVRARHGDDSGLRGAAWLWPV